MCEFCEGGKLIMDAEEYEGVTLRIDGTRDGRYVLSGEAWCECGCVMAQSQPAPIRYCPMCGRRLAERDA